MLPSGMLPWLNRKYPEAQFIDDDDAESFLTEQDMLDDLIDDFNGDNSDELTADREEVDSLVESDDDDDDDDDDIILDDDDAVSDERCKDIIDEDDALYSEVVSWARANYEPAKGMSEQEIGAKFVMDEDWGTALATAYFEANPDTDADEDGTHYTEEVDVNGDGDVDIVETCTDGDGESEVVVTKADDAAESAKVEKHLADDEARDTFRNIANTLGERRW